MRTEIIENEETSDQISRHMSRVARNVQGIGQDTDFLQLSQKWLEAAIGHEAALNYTWLGRPIIQMPHDIYAMQEIIWSVRPDLIIETGIAHGGSLIMSASILAMLDYCDAVETGVSLDPKEAGRKVVGLDVDIRQHNREAIESHPMGHKIEMIEGSSIAPEVAAQVKSIAEDFQRVLIFLDSNHTHEHVLAELEAYAPITTVGSYCVVWDTGVEDLPEGFCRDRPWGKGNNPKTAVWEYFRILEEEGRLGSDAQPLHFEKDKTIEHKIVVTAAPDGFLKRIK